MRCLPFMLLWASVSGAVELSNELVFTQPVPQQLSVGVYKPRIAHGGGVSLLVWADTRSSDGRLDIYATRLDAAGNILDRGGLHLCSAPEAQYGPAVTWTGTHFLVVWQEHHASAPNRLQGTRVTPDGEVLDPATGFPIAEAWDGDGTYELQVASSGPVSLVVFHRDNATSGVDVLGARVASDGTVLDSTPLVLSAAPGRQAARGVAAGTGGFFVTWEDERASAAQRDVYGTRVSTEGVVLDAEGLAVSTLSPSQQSNPHVAFDGTNYAVAWHDTREDGVEQLYAARVSPEGRVLDTDGLRLTTASGAKSGPAIGSDGTRTWVLWQDSLGNTIHGTRLGPSGEVTPSVQLFRASRLTLRDVIPEDSAWRVLWADVADYQAPWSVLTGRFEPDGTVADADGAPVLLSVNQQDLPRVASAPGSSLLAWDDTAGGSEGNGYRVHVQRLDARGQPTGQPVALDAPRAVLELSVAFNGREYLVVWDAFYGKLGTRIVASRVREDGAVIDNPPLMLSQSQTSHPWVASDGNRFFVVWTAQGVLQGAEVSPSGGLRAEDPVRPIAFSTAAQAPATYPGFPSVAFDGTRYLVTWTDLRASPPTVHARRRSVSGEWLDPEEGVLIGQTGTQQRRAHLTARPDGGFFITWVGAASNSTSSELRAARISPEGTVRDPGGFIISSGPGGRHSPWAEFDGTAFLVAWQQSGTASSGLQLARVAADGTLLTPEPVRAWEDGASNPAMSRVAPGHVLLVYQRHDASPGVNVTRVRGRNITVPYQGEPDGGTDAGTDTDAGTQPDAGDAPGGGDDEPGCGCTATGAPLWGLLTLALLLRRRRG